MENNYMDRITRIMDIVTAAGTAVMATAWLAYGGYQLARYIGR
jgi:hypothetical protein